MTLWTRVSCLTLHGLFAGVYVSAQSTTVILTMDKVMTSEQLRLTGVDGLAPAQRAALDRGLSEYTVKLIGLAQRSDSTPKASNPARGSVHR